MQLHDLGDDGIHGSVIFHQLHGLVDHQIFQPLFPHGLFITGLFLLGSGTLVIGVHFPGVADTAFPEHQRTALTAVQLGGEQITFLCLMTGRGLFIFRQLFLHLVEQILRHKSRNCVGLYHIPQTQFADVPAAAQHPLNGVIGHFPTGRILDSPLIQPVLNICHCRTVCILLENLLYIRSRQRFNLVVTSIIDHVAKRHFAAIINALESVLGHSAHDLFGQVSRVIFGISLKDGFQNDALRTSRNDFRCRYQFHAVPLQLGLVPGTVVAVPGKAIQLPDDDDIKDATLAVFDHLLELRAIICFCRNGTVDIVLHHREAVLLCIGGAFPNLTFDGFFTLTVSRITSIDHGGHGRHLPFIQH